MTGTTRKPPPSETRERLIAAAAEAFNTHGFHGTDSNRIARAAGYAPQTFYRHFTDKTDIFIRVYERWQADEQRDLAEAIRAAPRGRPRSLTAAEVMIEAHRRWAGFRRSLRLLAVEDHRVRAARAESRRKQLAPAGPEVPDWPERVAALLTIERLCDAIADAEIGDLAVSEADWAPRIADAIEALRVLSRQAPASSG